MLKDGRSRHKLYSTYMSMVGRCYRISASHYEHYGERGIRVCDEWLGESGFWNFVKDMGDRPDGLSLDRINNDGNYEPSNCRWATNQQQKANRRMQWNNKSGFKGVTEVLVKGEPLKVRKWSASIMRNGVLKRLSHYNSPEEASAAYIKACEEYAIAEPLEL